MSLNGSLYRRPRTASPDSPDGSLMSFDSSSSGTLSNAWSGTFPPNINLNIAAFPGVFEQSFASNRAPSSSSYNAYSFGVLSGTGDDAAASLGGSSASGMDYFASPQNAWDVFFGGQTSAAISLPQTLPNVFNSSGFGADYELGVGNSRDSEWPQAFPAANRKTGSKKSENGKKQVMACLFCRERKIGCIRPQEDEPDQTCNQCMRRKRVCVYPTESRRGHHARNRMNSRRFLGIDQLDDFQPYRPHHPDLGYAVQPLHMGPFSERSMNPFS